MVSRKRSRSSGMFLMELILAILIFSIASVVCVQFFVKSYTLGKEAKEVSQAVSWASDVAEIIQTSDSGVLFLESLTEVYPMLEYDEPAIEMIGEGSAPACMYKSIRIFFDSEYTPSLPGEGRYVMVINFAAEPAEPSEDGGNLTGSISVKKLVGGSEDDEVYYLYAEHHIAGRTDHE